MTELFDASAFILAERSQTLAPVCKDFAADFGEPIAAEIRHSDRVPDETLATIATLAATPAEIMPWDDLLLPWAEGPRPHFVKPEVWDELTNEAVAFSRNWGTKAIAAGWSSLDLFGCYRRPWFRRIDCNGVVATIVGMLTPMRVMAVCEAYIEIADHRGNGMRFRPRDRANLSCSVHLWEAYVMTTGP